MRRTIAVAMTGLGLAVSGCGGGGGGMLLPQATTVVVTPNPATVPAGLSTRLSVLVRDQNGIPFTDTRIIWSSSAPSVATVSDVGEVTGVTPGTAIITATADGKQGTASLTVTPAPVAALSITPSTGMLRVGGLMELGVSLRDRQGATLTNRQVSWTSSDATVLAASANGVVVGVAPGQATVTATSEGVSATATFTVTTIPIASIAVSPGSATLSSGTSLPLQVTVRDSLGAIVAEPQVGWSSSASNVAIVSANGVVTAVAQGTAIITASIGGKSATVAIDVTLPAFNPTSNRTLGGRVTFVSVNIPAGVTVTVTSALVMEVSGSITIAGTITGACLPLQITGASALNVTGTINNACTNGPSDAPPSLRLIGRAGLNARGGHLLSSGHLVVVTDSALIGAVTVAGATSMARAPMPRARLAAGRSSTSLAAAAAGCDLASAELLISPSAAPNGAAGVTGTAGRRGNDIGIACEGNILLTNTRIMAQHGGKGGDATVATAGAGALGGAGGVGGAIVIKASGDIDVGGGAAFTAGNGGAGGSATATPPNDGAALATGGDGAPTATIPGTAAATILIAADGRLSFSTTLQLRTGAGGPGGHAVASAGKGSDATTTASAKAGGDATAVGGNGGAAGTWEANGLSGVSGIATVQVIAASAAQGGAGGTATATGGTGGKGSDFSPNGGAGGAIVARGGNGGRSAALDATGAPAAVGGNGGSARFFQGTGGRGFAYCSVLDPRGGGAGGRGGDASGSGGTEGAPAIPGAPTGLPGGVELENLGNGGAGGHGGAAGPGGSRGDNTIVLRGIINSKGVNFQTGVSGSPCLYNVVVTITNDAFNNNPLVNYAALTQIAITASPTTIFVTGLPGVDLLGGPRLPADSTFIATGVGTFGAFTNVPVLMTGTLGGGGTLVATLTVGQASPPTGIPGGPVVYTVRGAPVPVVMSAGRSAARESGRLRP